MPMALHTAPRTRAELLALPDDGNRHELIDGEHLVTPAPGPRHQWVLYRLYDALRPHIGAHGLGTLAWSPADLTLGADEVLQPDLFVAPISAPPDHWSDITSLLLVIEIVSPTSGRIDRERKRLRYQRARVPHYWIVDPDQCQVEVWHPDATVGEVWRDTLIWPVPAEAPLVVDLVRLFAD